MGSGQTDRYMGGVGMDSWVGWVWMGVEMGEWVG